MLERARAGHGLSFAGEKRHVPPRPELARQPPPPHLARICRAGGYRQRRRYLHRVSACHGSRTRRRVEKARGSEADRFDLRLWTLFGPSLTPTSDPLISRAKFHGDYLLVGLENRTEHTGPSMDV